MKWLYILEFSADACKMVPSIGKALEPLQNVLAEYASGRMRVAVGLLRMTFTVGHRLSRKERDAVKSASLSAIREKFADYDVELVSMRGKSCKSGSQPNSTAEAP